MTEGRQAGWKQRNQLAEFYEEEGERKRKIEGWRT